MEIVYKTRYRAHSSVHPKRQGGIYSLNIAHRIGAYLPKDLSKANQNSSLRLRQSFQAQSAFQRTSKIYSQATKSMQVAGDTNIRQVFLQESMPGLVSNSESYMQMIKKSIIILDEMQQQLSIDKGNIKTLADDLRNLNLRFNQKIDDIVKQFTSQRKLLKNQIRQNLKYSKTELVENKQQYERHKGQWQNIRSLQQMAQNQLIKLQTILL